MSTLERILLALAALSAALVAVLAASLAARFPDARLELGRARLASLTDADRARLAALPEPVLVRWYRTPPEAMPSHLRGMEREVRRALEEMRRASAGRLEWRILDPDEGEEWRAYVAALGVSPARARQVERDGWRETRLWSSLRVTSGASSGAVLNGLWPEHLPALPELVLALAAEERAPRRAVVALDAPADFEDLRAWLAERVDLCALDLGAGDRPGPEVDLLLWLDPRSVGPATLAVLEDFLARGGSAVVAGSGALALEREQEEGIPLRIAPSAFDAATFLSHYGLRPVEGLVLDPSACGELPFGEGGTQAPHRLRAIAPHQDFQGFRGQPNGSLAFVAPTAFEPDAARLSELGLEISLLVTTSPRALRVAPPREEIPLALLTELPATPIGKRAVMAALRSADPWRGTLVVMGAADPWRDGFLRAPGHAHRPLLRVVLDTLLAPERLALRGLAPVAPSLPSELGAAERALWRLFVIGAAPLTLVLLAWRRRTTSSRRAKSERAAIAWRVALGLAAGLALPALMPAVALELAESGLRLTREEIAALEGLRGGEPLELELWTSAPSRLPPELRAAARAAEEQCAELARALSGTRTSRRIAGELDAEEEGRLQALGLRTHLVRSDSEEESRARQVVSALRVRRGERSVVLELPNPSAFDALRFRLALSLSRLARPGIGRVALVADAARLSPAEAHLEYQQRSLFPPGEGDVYGELRALLEANDFDLRGIDSDRPPEIDPEELLLWVQPRRDARPMYALLGRHLSRGGRAIVAGQHFDILARQLEGTALELGFWPRPLFCDLERWYLPELGIALERQVLLDRLHAPLEIRTRVDRPGGSPEFILQASAQPFLLRAAEPNRPPEGEALRGLGDLLFPFGNRIAIDAPRLAARGIRAETWAATTAQAWSYDWKGGDLPAELLLDPPGDLPGLTRFDRPQPLVVRFRGPFPAADFDRSVEGLPELVVDAEPGPGPEGDLLLIGGARMFRNELLRHAGFRHDLFALRAVAELGLGPELSLFLRQREAPPGWDHVEPRKRWWWRAAVVGSFPLLLLLFTALWRRWR